MHLPDFIKMSSIIVGKRGRWVSIKDLYHVFMNLCKGDYATNKFIHVPIFRYNEVMCLLKITGVAEQA